MNIVYIEQCQGDITLMHLTMQSISPSMQLKIITQSEEAISYFDSIEKNNDFNSVDLIILSLKLDRISGISILSHIKKSEALNKIPVVVYSHYEDLLEECKKFEDIVILRKHHDILSMLDDFTAIVNKVAHTIN